MNAREWVLGPAGAAPRAKRRSSMRVANVFPLHRAERLGRTPCAGRHAGGVELDRATAWAVAVYATIWLVPPVSRLDGA